MCLPISAQCRLSQLVRGDHHEVIHIEADDGHVGMNEHAVPARDLSPAQLGQD